MRFDMLKALAFAVLFGAASCAHAAQPSGEYVLGGQGTLLISFDGAGNYTGIGALPTFGIVTIQGTAPVDASGKIVGTFALIDQRTSATLYSGAVRGSATAGNTSITLTLATRPSQTFRGSLRTGVEPVPGGQYFRTQLPTSLIFQCDRSGDRQVVSLQGDQDYILDLTQAVGGQILFNQSGDGYGVVYEDGNPANPPRWAAAHYNPGKDQLSLLLTTALIGGRKKALVFLGTGSTGKYDGVYLANIAAGNCPTVQVKLTVKDGIVSGTDANTGTISGTLDDSGNLSFTTQRLVEPVGCSQGGTHTGTITFTGTPTHSPVYPTILDGTFSGAGTSGTFTIQQPSGITGATTPGNLSRAETWAGTFIGSHESILCPGAVFGESFTVSLSFPSSLIAALRGKTQILSGSGSMSGTETIKVQAAFPTAICGIKATTLSGASVNVTFAGIFNGTRPSIEFDSTTTVLLSNTVHFGSGPNMGKDIGEDRHIIKFREAFMTATLIKGGWNDGTFILRKQ
ncbi:MAG: hypothetical protein WCT04_11415 [Planctomycetota bacterium]